MSLGHRLYLRHRCHLHLRLDHLRLGKSLLSRISLGHHLHNPLHQLLLNLRFHHELLSLLISVDQKSYLVIRLTEAQRMCRPI